MFGKKKMLRDDLPAIDIRKKQVKGVLGNTKWVPTSKKEQRRMKAELMKQYPDRWFADDLKEYNSVDERNWIDDMEEFLAATED